MNLIKYYKIGIIYIIKSPYIFIKYFYIGLKSLILTFPIILINKLTSIFKKEKSPKKIISLSILSLSLITYLLSVFIITRWYVQTERNKKFSNSLINESTFITIDETPTNEYQDTNIEFSPSDIQTETKPSLPNTNQTYSPNFININLDYYINKNNETVGWIQIENTKINYPIVQHKDNSYYLNHDFYNKKTSIGWIFADYRNNFETLNNNTILYGHNLIDHYMFGILPTFLNKNWINKKQQHYIKIVTKNSNTIWEIFSVYKIPPTTDYLQTTFYSIETYQNFIDTITNRSTHKLNVPVDTTDKIITLSTCDNTGKNRVVIHAKLIKIKD